MTAGHDYLSTACWHELNDGRPALRKECRASCTSSREGVRLGWSSPTGRSACLPPAGGRIWLAGTPGMPTVRLSKREETDTRSGRRAGVHRLRQQWRPPWIWGEGISVEVGV